MLLNGAMINKLLGKDMEGHDYGLTSGITPPFALKD
jgi:hypothetical protein